MTDRIDTYDVGPHAHLSVQLHAGDVRLKEGPAGRMVVQLSGSPDALDAIDIEATSDGVSVRTTAKRKRWFIGGSVDAVLTIPTGSDVSISLGAGDVVATLPVGDVEVNAGAGDVRLEDVMGTTEIKVGSGDIRGATLKGTAKIASASGDVRIDAATDLTITTAAGDLFLGEVTEAANVRSATGDIRVRRFSGTDLEIKTMSGDAHVGIAPGMVINASIKTMSGDLRNRIKPTSGERVGTMNLTITSFTGDVILRTAK